MPLFTLRDSSSSFYLLHFKDGPNPGEWQVEVQHTIETYNEDEDVDANIGGVRDIIDVMVSDDYNDLNSAESPELLYTKNFLEDWLNSPDSKFNNVRQSAETPNAYVEFIIPKNTTITLDSYGEDPVMGSITDTLDAGLAKLGLARKQIHTLGVSQELSEVNQNSHIYYFLGEAPEEAGTGTIGSMFGFDATAIMGVNIPSKYLQPAPPVQPTDPLDPNNTDDSPKGGLTDDQRKKALPLNEQAILLYRLAELMPLNREKRNSKDYDRFACLECADSNQIANLINLVTSPTDRSAIFDLARPVHLSSIIPRIRLFKQYVPNSKRMKGDSNTNKEPRILVEYEFEEYSQSDLLSQTLSTNTGAGIESFDFDFNGENQFAAEKLVSANLKLRARSVDELERLRTSSTTKRKYRYSDLFIPEVLQQDNTGHREKITDYATYELKNFENRIRIEYGIDENSPAFRSPGGEKVKEAFKKCKLDLNLQLVSHQIELRDDGSLLVDINFIGRFDASSIDPNSGNILVNKKLHDQQLKQLLNDRERAQETADRLSELDDELAAEEAERPVTEENATIIVPVGQGDDLSGASMETTAVARQQVQAQLGATTTEYRLGDEDGEKRFLEENTDSLSKLKLYRSLLNALVEKDCIKVLSIDPSNILKTKAGLGDDAPDGLDTLAEGKPDLTTKKQIDDEFKRLSDKMKNHIIPMFTSDTYYIRFFYFGDLMDVVLDNFYEDNADDASLDLRSILGPIEIVTNVYDSFEFQDPVKFSRQGAIVVADKYGTFDPKATRLRREAAADANRIIEEGRTPPIDSGVAVRSQFASLADIPISLNLFLRWFAENVSNRGSFSYSYKKFLVDAAQSLIVASLQADSTKVLLPKQKRQIRTIAWDGVTDLNKPDVFGFTHPPGKELKIEMTKEQRNLVAAEGLQVSRIQKSLRKNTAMRPDAYMSDYLLVYADTPRYNRDFTGKQLQYLRDLKDGIYHLAVGRDVGIVKDVKMSAVSVPGYEEMMIQRAIKNGNRPTKRIYQATVSMYGVTFFRPGQTVYLEASAFGSRENLKAFGLCGYYTVITVSSRFANGSFETVLECQFKHSG